MKSTLKIFKTLKHIAIVLCLVAFGYSTLGAKSLKDILSKNKKAEFNMEISTQQCNNGDGISCLKVAQHLIINDYMSDYTQARIYYQKSCQLGIKVGCNELMKLNDTPAQVYYGFWHNLNQNAQNTTHAKIAQKGDYDEDDEDWKYENDNGVLGQWLQ